MITTALRTGPSAEGTGKGEMNMAKKLELKFLTSANTDLLVSVAEPKEDLQLAAVQAAAAKILPVLANSTGAGAASFVKAVMVTTTEEEIQ